MDYLLIPLVWLAPVALMGIINALYRPRKRLRIGTQKFIQRAVLIFYRYKYQVRSVRVVDVCPLCKKSNMRCRVTINPITGMRVHTSLNRRRQSRIEYVRVTR